MPDRWQAFVRAHAGRPLSEQAVEELAHHVEDTYAAAIAAGRSEDEALTLARAQLEHGPRRLPPAMAGPSGGLAGMAAGFARDVRYALRMLGARPAFTAVAVLTLALGIGANTAIFSVVRTLVLQRIPFHDPARLVMLWEADAANPKRTSIMSMPNYVDFSRSIAAFETTGIFEYLSYNFSGDGEAERVQGLRLSASTFRVLGVEPELGRTFTDDEDLPGHDVVVISHALWQRRFGGRPDIV